jgi:PAS domain S-box-containing protein
LDKALTYVNDIIATLREPFVVLGHDLRIKTANRAFYKSFHVTQEETDNHALYDLGDGAWDSPGLRALLDKVVSLNHSVEEVEVEHTFPTIGRKTMLLNARPFPPDGTNPELILLAIEDITERKQMEAVAKVSEVRYRRLFEAAKDGILILNVSSGKIIDANPFMSDLLGYPKEYFLEKELWEIGLFQDIKASQVAFKELQTGGYLRYDHLPLKTNHGGQIAVELVSNVYQEDHQDVIQCNIRDISERSRLEKALADSEVRYRRLFETAQDAILILDEPSGKILDANPFIEEMLGYSHAEIVGKEVWEIGMFRDAEENKAAFRELQAKGYIRYENLPLKTRDGKPIEVEFVSNVYQVDQRNVIQCNIRDITDRSRLERQTHEQAKALAELHYRKDEFLAMLSHELRNPLSAISSALHVLRLQGNENPIQQRAMTTMERQVGQLAHLVDDLLEVSRVITGRIQLQLECLDLRSIAEQAVEAVRPLIERRKHELSVSLPAEPVWVQGDPTRLEQVIVNLLNNAAKYSDEGGHVWLTVEQGDGEVEAVLRVRDTGVGIAPELLPRIFDLFTQADRTLDRSEGGLGIGLSLVQKLVELHNGKVSIHSAGLGQGSEFIVRLPALSTAGQRIAPAPIETAELSTQTVRVLVVDDNVDVADMIVMLLQLFGHEAKAAYSGQSALETATEYKPDVVLLDIGLPDINGYEVARQMRRQPQTKDVRLIAMTGYGQDSDRQRSQEAGCEHHLVKPVDPEKLQDLLARRVKPVSVLIPV